MTWIRSDGAEMDEEDWADLDRRSIGMLLSGRATDEVDQRGRVSYGDTVLLLLNGGNRSRLWTLPRVEWHGSWEALLNTAHRLGARPVRSPTINLTAHSAILLRHNDRL